LLPDRKTTIGGSHMSDEIHPALRRAIDKVTGKRPRTVIDHILKHGIITTEDLEQKYGYNHPPRAARDVREAGVPLVTIRVRGTHGRMIAAYKFGDPAKIERHKSAGRRTFSKPFKQALYARSGGRCEMCACPYEERYLQVDHCIPYEVAGDSVADENKPDEFLIICASCQRSKSWSCEHCENFQVAKDVEMCRGCLWASPESYSHIAGTPHRRLSVVWSGREVGVHDALCRQAAAEGMKPQELLKRLAAGAIRRGSEKG